MARRSTPPKTTIGEQEIDTALDTLGNRCSVAIDANKYRKTAAVSEETTIILELSSFMGIVVILHRASYTLGSKIESLYA
jgi:hypothetical protein